MQCRSGNVPVIGNGQGMTINTAIACSQQGGIVHVGRMLAGRENGCGRAVTGMATGTVTGQGLSPLDCG